MIKLYCPFDGRTHWVKPSEILRVESTSDKQEYHGHRSTVWLSDGSTIKCGEKPEAIVALTEGPPVWLTSDGRAFGRVSDEQIDMVLHGALVDVANRNGWPDPFGRVEKLGDCGNAECGWRGPISETSMCGAIGPLCPKCREIVEPD